MNGARSALNFYTLNSLALGDNPFVVRLFKSFYRLRPMRPKHVAFWPVALVLNLLKSWHPPQTLTLKTLTLKTLSLIALSSSDRGQTLHALNIEHTCIENDSVQFLIYDVLKTTKPTSGPKIVTCPSTSDPSLNVCDYVLRYMLRTLPARVAQVNRGKDKPTQLFLSWQTKLPVTTQTLARWLKSVLQEAGVDTSSFSAHSFRGAGLSAARRKGASVHQIVKAGDWTNASTFETFYNKPSTSSSIGRLILDS